MRLINSIISIYLSNLYKHMQQAEKDIHARQDKMLQSFIRKARKTDVGREFGFSSITNYKDYARQVPVRRYDDIRTQILRMMEGQTNILWPGLVTWFAKSSGTTEDKSKFIPVTPDHLNHTHNR